MSYDLENDLSSQPSDMIIMAGLMIISVLGWITVFAVSYSILFGYNNLESWVNFLIWLSAIIPSTVFTFIAIGINETWR